MENENLAKSHGKVMEFSFWEKYVDCLHFWHTMTLTVHLDRASKIFYMQKVIRLRDTRFWFWSDRCGGGGYAVLNVYIFIFV